MAEQINFRDLAAMVRAKRGKRGLRDVARDIGEVSASTLSRIEQGKVPDLGTFTRICQWLGVPSERFMIGAEHSPGVAESTAPYFPNSSIHTPDIVAAYLRADRTLDPDTAEALVKMIQLAYAAADRGELGKKK